MSTEVAPKILPTRKFKETFYRCFSRRTLSLRIVSPFVDKLPGFQTIVNFSRYFLKDDNAELQLVTCPPSTRSEYIGFKEAEALILLGVDLRIRSQPKLHSKVYQFKFTEGDTASFVGSANFTMGGFERNDESVAYFRSKEENKLVEAEINRLANYGTKSYTQWKTFNSRRKKGKQ